MLTPNRDRRLVATNPSNALLALEQSGMNPNTGP
jgi:hypothetical protein